ncbi:hypothetical protein MPSEU_000173000 [Mayamaea pseudoterrestris]|nr:hypothetical protein MPSEU_000173000 [Mayamaea pseudoterrestris]
MNRFIPSLLSATMTNPAVDIRDYTGGNTLLPNEPYCQKCDKTLDDEGSALMCVKCHLVRYCNKDCQKKNATKHNKFCKLIKNLNAKLDIEEYKLRNFQDDWGGAGDDDTEDYKETMVGDFWLVDETRDYMRARCEIVNACQNFLKVNGKENKLVLTMALDHSMGMLRLCRGDNLGTRYNVPLLLLRLNRNDHAYSFCRFWIKDQLGLNGVKKPEKEKPSVEGDDKSEDEANEELLDYDNDDDNDECSEASEPIPPEGFNDIFEELGLDEKTLKGGGLPFLLSMLILKARIVAALQGQEMREGQAFQKQEMLLTQTKIRDSLMNVVDKANPSILPALLYPDPLMKAYSVLSFWSTGEPSEAAMVLKESLAVWQAIPGTRKLLIERFGSETPAYPCK